MTKVGFTMYKMIVLDIDGTLLNSKHEITPKTKESLLEAQEKGYKVVLSSGRPTPAMYKLADDLELKKYGSYISSYNGGELIRMDTEETIFSLGLVAEEQHLIFDVAKKNGINVMSYTKEMIVTQDSDEYIDIESKVCEMEIESVRDFKQAVNFQSGKCLMTAHPEKIAEVFPTIQSALGEQFNLATSAPFFIECTKFGVDKGAGLVRLAEILGIELEEMIACGDGLNDLPMLQVVGLSVAMGNANDTVKAACDYTTLSNDEDGIAHVVEKFLLSQEVSV